MRKWWLVGPIAVLLGMLGLPLLGLVFRTSPRALLAAWQQPDIHMALLLSLTTSVVSLAIIVSTGLPLAWWLSRGSGKWQRVVRTVVALPVVMPPAVLGVALLEVFGREGLLGGVLGGLGVTVVFTPVAVVLAQVVVATPLFVLPCAAAFRKVDDALLLVAHTLGASPMRAWWSVALPASLGGILSGAVLAWARALGEFGATLVFAGNLPGKTQTLPLAIFQALERDLAQAQAISVLLLLLSVVVVVPAWRQR